MGAFSGTGSGAATGAGTGAAIGSFWGPIGTAVGAGVGALGGGIYGYFNGKSEEEERNRKMGDIKAQLEAAARKQRMQREADLQRALAYFQPVQQELTRLYGRPTGGGGGTGTGGGNGSV